MRWDFCLRTQDETQSAERQDALTERRELIEQRANEILDRAVSEKQDWALGLGESPAEQRATATWRREARTVAAYRDRYGTLRNRH